jgi:hypothetical protein
MLSTGRVGHQVRKERLHCVSRDSHRLGSAGHRVAAAGDATVKVKPFRLVVVLTPLSWGLVP